MPAHDERHLFEMPVLEGTQAGLSWRTILDKRENHCRAFDNFDVEKIVRYRAGKLAQLLADPGIVRNRLKITATVDNARATLALRDEGIALNEFLWQFTDGKPRQNLWPTHAPVPAFTPQSDA